MGEADPDVMLEGVCKLLRFIKEDKSVEATMIHAIFRRWR